MGWAVVGALTLFLFQRVERLLIRRDEQTRPRTVTVYLLAGAALYYLVLVFNLGVTFAIGEVLLGWVGIFLFPPITAVLLARLLGRL